jgi:hypothetical protein
MTRASQKRRRMRGTLMKKLDRSTFSSLRLMCTRRGARGAPGTGESTGRRRKRSCARYGARRWRPFMRNPIAHRCDEVADLREWNPGNVLED